MTVDPTKVSFSQAQGLEPLPRQLQLGELPENARTGLWNAFYLTHSDGYIRSFGIDPSWNEVLASVHAELFHRGLDTFSTDFNQVMNSYRGVFAEAPFNKVFDLILHIARHERCPEEFHARVASALQQHRLAYFYEAKSRTIFQASTPEEGQAIIDAVRELNDYGLDGAQNHLMQSAAFINQSEWAQSVHESISAVESIGVQIAPKGNTLGAALKNLSQQGISVHPALNEGFGNLYGYTSNEQGVRHALLDQGQSNVGQDEAVFMLGACASFASYLWRKHLASGSTS